MPRGNAAEALSSDISSFSQETTPNLQPTQKNAVEDSFSDILENDGDILDQRVEEPIDNSDDVTEKEDTQLTDISNALQKLDTIQNWFEPEEKKIFQKQQKQVESLLEKRDLDKAIKMAELLLSRSKNESKLQKDFENKKKEIELRMSGSFTKVVGTREDVLKTAEAMYSQMLAFEKDGKMKKAAEIATKITNIFHAENLTGEKAQKKELLLAKSRLSDALQRIPNWREQSFLVNGIDKIDRDEQMGHYVAALQTSQYLLESLKNSSPEAGEVTEDQDRTETLQILEGIDNRLEYGKNVLQINPSERARAKIESYKQEIRQLLLEGKNKEAKNEARLVLENLQKTIPKPDFNDKRSIGGKKGRKEIKEQLAQERKISRTETEPASLPDFFDSGDTPPVTRKLKIDQTAQEKRATLSSPDTAKPGKNGPDRFQELDAINFADDEDIVSDTDRINVDDESTQRINRPRRSIEQLSAEARRLNTIAKRVTTTSQERQPVGPPPIPTEVSQPTRAEIDTDQSDFSDVTVPERKGFFGRMKELLSGGSTREKAMRAQEKKEKREERISLMDREQVLSEMLRYDVNLYGGGPRDQLAKVTKLLRGVDAPKFEPLWNRYLEVQKEEKNKWDAAIEKMDLDDVTKNMKQFDIDIDSEAAKATRSQIDALLKETSPRGEVFRKLYGKYVEIQNNNIAAMEHATSKEIKSFLKDTYGVDAAKYLKGDKKETAKISLLRSEYSQRRRVIDAAITILENESMPNSPAEKAQLRENFPKTVQGVEKIKTLPEISLFLKEMYGIDMNKNTGEISNPDYFNVLTKAYEIEAKNGKKESAQALKLVDAALERSSVLAKNLKNTGFKATETFIGQPGEPNQVSERAA